MSRLGYGDRRLALERIHSNNSDERRSGAVLMQCIIVQNMGGNEAEITGALEYWKNGEYEKAENFILSSLS